MFIKKFLFFLILLATGGSAVSQLQITSQSNAQQLAQYLVGDGVSISNATITGSGLASGRFKNISGTNIGIDSGIVLSTGRVLTSGNFAGLNGNAGNNASTSFNMAGDADLSLLVNKVTKDALYLEFDFIPQGDTVSFRYVFSSEEYPGFVCSNYNDVFAFFISGPGIAGTRNMALIPNTNIPVAINSINSGTPGGFGSIATCQAMGLGSPFTQYYLDNAVNANFTHNGHTTVMTAWAKVQPCQVYHLKIAIADVIDDIYDSNVFIEARSLKSSPTKLVSQSPVAGGLPYMAEGCHTGSFKILRSRKFPYPQVINLIYGGTAINGVDVELLPASAIIPSGDSMIQLPILPIVDNIIEGIEHLKIYVSNGCEAGSGIYLDSLIIQIRDFDVLALSPADTVVCINNSIQLIVPSTYSSYQWTPSTGLNNASISNPVLTPQASASYVCTATTNNCNARDSVFVGIKSLKLLSKTDILCKNGNSGQIRVSGGREWKTSVQYSINNGSFGADSTFNNLSAGTYWVKIKDNTCSDSIQVTLTQSLPDLLLADSIITASCTGQNGEVHLKGSGGKQPYAFAIGNGTYSGNASFTGITGGNHFINIKDDNGCITSRTVTVANDQPMVSVITVDPESCNGSPEGKILFNASGGSGIYEYSINNGPFQADNNFTVTVSNIVGTVKDSKGCTDVKTAFVPLNVAVFVNAGNDTTICEGTKLVLPVQSNATQFSWQPSPSLNGTTLKNPEASPSVTTTYYVTATRDICVVKDTITITVNPAPVANAGNDKSICIGKTVVLSGSGGESYSWLPANAVSDPSSANPETKPKEDTRYILQVTNINGCRSIKNDTVWVYVVPSVQAFAGRDTSVGIGQPLQLYGMDLAGAGVTSYVWSPSTGLDDPNISNPIATIDRDITYTLTLTTPEGCEGQAKILIRAFEGPEIYVPNAFTPNGDGKNDILKAFPVGMKEFRFFRVFNRWGEMIFSTANPNRGWDGTIRGLKQNTGTYVWMAEAVDFRGNVVSRRGSVTIVR